MTSGDLHATVGDEKRQRNGYRFTCASVCLLAACLPWSATADEFQTPTAAAVPKLVAALQDENLRHGAVVALAKVGRPAVEELIRALQDESTARWAAFALGRIGPEALPAVGELAQAASREDAVLQSVAAEALGRIGPGAAAAVPTLLELLRDGTVQVRREAALALGRIHPEDEKVAAALVAGLADEPMRAVCQDALLELGKVAAPALARSLGDDAIRLEVAAVLRAVEPATAASLGVDQPSPADIPALVLAVRTFHRPAAARQAAAASLGDLAAAAEPAQVRIMLAALVEVLSDDAVRMAAAKALSRFGEPAIPSLVAAIQSPDAKVRQAAALAVMHMGEPGVTTRPALVSLLQDRDRDVRRAAAQALEAVGADAAEAVPALVKVVGSNDAEPVRAAAVKALVRAEPAAKPAVVDAFLSQIRDDNSYGIRKLCEWGLKKVDPVAAEKANIP